MSETKIAKASVDIDRPVARVWDALVTPEIISRYMMGANVVSEWTEGSSIVWRGEWKGKAYEDKGVILGIDPRRFLRYSHFSPLGGLPDKPENYHTVTIQLAERGGNTHVALAQDNNPTDEARQHSEKNWTMMLEGLKKVVES